MPRLSFAIRVLFACCLLIATANHIRADFQHGLLWDYGYGDSAYWASRVFWGALTFFDPLAVLLLFKKPRMGIILTVVIILADVAHNTYYVALNKQWLEPFYLSQVAFLIAVVLLSPIVWRRTISRVALANPILATEFG
ncbi:hypothetical protein [Pseudomonas kulmbachensis]|uniref:Uncharacterized protein n=1 Tax=Pseudomonas kulmbachensis TaxID=3043408 RepID=A0ABW7LUU5_9PSED